MSDSSRTLRTLVLSVVLAIVGFGAGLLAGGLFQNPGRVADLLLGDSGDVTFREQRPSAATEALTSVLAAAPIQDHAAMPVGDVSLPPSPDEAASPIPLVSRPSGVRHDPKTLQEIPALPSVSAAPPHSPATLMNRSGLAVQVGAFRSIDEAMALAAQLRAKDYDVYLSSGPDSKDAWWRVRVGPLPSMAKARSTALRLKSKENLPTWLLVEDG